MADQELFNLNGGVGLTSAELAGGMGFYLVDPVNGSRFVTLDELKTYVNTDPTVVPSSVPWRGARVALSANQSITNSAVVAMTWATEAEDTDSFWSLAAPTRLVIPNGVTRVRVASSVYFATNTAGLRQVSIRKNGADFAGMGMTRVNNSSAQTGIQCRTADVAVVAGDYFEAYVVQSSGGALNVEAVNQTWFGITVVEATI